MPRQSNENNELNGPPAEFSAPSDELDISVWSRAIIQQWWLVLACAAVAVIASFIVVRGLVAQEWVAEASIIGVENAATLQASVLRSDTAMGKLAGLGVTPSADLSAAVLRSFSLQAGVVEECELVQEWGCRTRAQAVRRLGQATTVSTDRPNLVRIAVKLSGRPKGLLGSRPADTEVRELAARIANAHVSVLKTQLGQLRISGAKRQREFLQAKLGEAERELTKSAERLAAWRREHQNFALDKAAELAMGQLSDLERSRAQALVERDAAANELKALERQLAQQPATETGATSWTLNPQIGQLESQLSDLEGQLVVATEAQHKTDDHPDVQKLHISIRDTQARLQKAYQDSMIQSGRSEQPSPVGTMLAQQAAMLRATRVASASRAMTLDALIRTGRQQMGSLSTEALEYSQLQLYAQVAQDRYETLVPALDQARLNEEAEEPGFNELDAAQPPDMPDGPSTKRSVMTGFVLGLLVGAIWAVRRRPGPTRPAQGS